MTNKKYALIFGCFGIIVLAFFLLIVGGYLYLNASASGQSVVFIRSPQNGQILETNQPVQVRALARDDQKITRIELWVDGILIDLQESNTTSGINPFPLLSTWYPSAGAHSLIVRAYNSRGESSQTSINVGATALEDRDLDGIADELDACPDAVGSEAADGCPDRDFDGIADLSDSCPDTAGLPPDGCPAPSASDRDGDGMLDTADACPDIAGSPLAEGCPDADGDGTADSADACPADPGAGVDGCPEPVTPADAEDPAPDGDEALLEPLPLEPLPGEDPPLPEDDEEPDEGSWFDDFFFHPFPLFEVSTPVEIEAYSLYIREPYDRMWCYVQLGDEDPRRYDFEPEEGQTVNQMWNIAEEFSGENSVHLLHKQNEPLAIKLNCFGANDGEEPVAMEELSATHPSEEWDGRTMELRPEGELTIQTRYHICAPSCDETILQIPLLAPIGTGPTGNGPYRLDWQWDGDESQINGFLIKRISMNTGHEDMIMVDNPSARSLDLADYMPACGERIQFHVASFYRSGDGLLSLLILSPHSNTEEWEADPCTYTAHVTFMTLDVLNVHPCVGWTAPIYGEFWISNGTTVESIEFNACHCILKSTPWEYCRGALLQSGIQYAINRDIFEWIRREQASCLGSGCQSNSYFAPDSSSLQISMESGDDISVGGRIMGCHGDYPDRVIYEEQETLTINVGELDYLTQVMQHTLEGEHLSLDYFIRMGQ